jgi:carbon-monoxide dehydrogenase large subunit
LEDARLLTGKGRYVDDLKMEGQVYMGVVRSPFAHARIKRIDFSKLRSSPDFIAALTGEDLLKEGVATVSELPVPAHKFANRHQLAVGKVRFAGEPVAAILVKRKNSLEDLVEEVEVEYETLPVVTSIEESKKRGTPIYEDWSDNIYHTLSRKRGDAESAIAAAPHVIGTREGIARQEAAPMEPRSVLVSYKREEDLYEVYATVQSVHFLRQYLSSELKIPEAKFHVKVMDMGGGFGSKGGNSYPEPVLACLFSKRTGLPVKWTATRTEEFLEAAAGRDEYCDVTLACDKNGRIVALKARIECDVGVSGTSAFMPSATVGFMLGTYEIPNLDLKVRCYVTNKMPVGPVRGAGRPEGCYFIERAMDIMARKIGLDPIEFRRRNVAEPESPNSESYQGLLDALVGLAHYEETQRWRDDLNARYKEEKEVPALVAGIGISLLGGEAGFSVRSMLAGLSLRGAVGMIRMLPRFRTFMGESGRVTLNKRGEVSVYTGSSPHGQGHETAFAQLASEELGVPIDRVKVMWGDSVLIPRGVGTFGSRSAAAGGSAVVDASRRLRSDLIEKASKILGKDRSSLDIRNGHIVEAKHPQNALIEIGDVLNRLGMTEISADSRYRSSSAQYSSSAHLCALTLDPKLGTIRIAKYVVVEDCGRMINKTIVEGQLHGGVVHAVGGSLFEKLAYDAEGNLLTSTMIDYNIPTALDSPNVEVFHKGTPSTGALNGAKGVGESGTMAGYAAVMNAVNDALAQVRPGAHLDIAPATPDAIVAAVGTNSEADSAAGRV